MRRDLLWLLLILSLVFLSGQYWGSVWTKSRDRGIIPNDSAEYLLPPTCPDDTGSLPFGAVCKDVDSGKLVYRDAAGIKELP